MNDPSVMTGPGVSSSVSPSVTVPSGDIPVGVTITDAEAVLSASMLASFRGSFADSPSYRLSQNAVTQTSADDVALNRSVVTTMDHTFSHKINTSEVTNQKKSGRCWMFAGLNLFRVGAMKKMKVEKFEFSQNFTLFWDKFERANYFLEAIIATADKPADDRVVGFLLDRPLDDGGQWNMFVNIIKKHGVVPQAAMPETESSSNTGRMNRNLLHKLREGAKSLREMRASGAPMEAARAAKEEILQVIHRMLCIHLGTPPESFDWQWEDKDKEFHRDGTMTPLQFAERYITLELDNFVCIVNDPRKSSPFGSTFTVQYLGNVVGGDMVKYLNVEMGVMKEVAMKMLMEGEAVWMGCDVGPQMRRDKGLWDANLFTWDTLYDTEFTMDKAARLEYHQTLMTHAMLFTGVDVVEGAARRWRVENSWGDDSGKKGFYVMNDSWFDEYMFEIAAPRSALPEELRDAIDAAPVVLMPWDPMGALAG